MGYLINEGYPEAAKKFSTEANIPPPRVAADNIEERVEIKSAIMSGQIEDAIERINDLVPEVSPHNSSPSNSYDYTRFMHHSYASAMGIKIIHFSSQNELRIRCDVAPPQCLQVLTKLIRSFLTGRRASTSLYSDYS